MWTKLLLGALFLAMIGVAFHFEPVRERSLLGTRATDGPRLRLMTWNIGNDALQGDSRAHDDDLKAIAETIIAQDPDAVALQELTSAQQLETLEKLLQQRYRGALSRFGNQDRGEAVLIKSTAVRFEDITAGDKYALAGRFQFHIDKPEIVLISAHADAFNAERRRLFTTDLIDWAHQQPNNAIVLIAGDFNFEIRSSGDSNLFTNSLKHDSESYNYILRYYRDLGREAGDTAVNERRIDYLFGPPEVVLLRRAEVLKQTTIGHMDHWPLLIEVAL